MCANVESIVCHATHAQLQTEQIITMGSKCLISSRKTALYFVKRAQRVNVGVLRDPELELFRCLKGMLTVIIIKDRA